MKKTILGLTTAITLVASNVAAAGQTVYGTITNVSQNWTYETRRVPYEDCTTVRVPVTGNYGGGSAGTDALAGMIIGGLIGKGVSGNDRGAAAGAVIGGVIGADNHRPRQRGPEYREEYRCVTNYEYTRESVQAGYIVDYMYEGYLYQFKTFKQYNIGDKIRLNIRVNPVN
jgi:uncharacterized protein YcfJ